MVRRGSTVRVRQRALQKPRKSGLSHPDRLAVDRVCGGCGARCGAVRIFWALRALLKVIKTVPLRSLNRQSTLVGEPRIGGPRAPERCDRPRVACVHRETEALLWSFRARESTSSGEGQRSGTRRFAAGRASRGRRRRAARALRSSERGASRAPQPAPREEPVDEKEEAGVGLAPI
jgi:hypothetical protein